MSDVTKSTKTCGKCKSASQVIRIQWQDNCGGPAIDYDDHVCLGCGLYADSGCRLGGESLKDYRMKHGYIVSRASASYRKLMNAAVKEAKISLAEGGIPIGAVLGTARGRILARGHNMRIQDGNPMAHAEIACMAALGRERDFNGLVLASTLMPCNMCAGAAIQFGIGTVLAGESQTFKGERELLESRGVKVEEMCDERCVAMMSDFIRYNPDIWSEDIGEKTNKRGCKAHTGCASCGK